MPPTATILDGDSERLGHSAANHEHGARERTVSSALGHLDSRAWRSRWLGIGLVGAGVAIISLNR